MYRTRIISIDPEFRRGEAENCCTIVPSCQPWLEWQGFEPLFGRSCSELRSICRRFVEPGVAVVACHPRFGVTGKVCIASKPGTINTAVVGRHDKVDLFLSVDPQIALRHLLVIAHPSSGPALFSVLDLRTGSGFLDEEDQRREAVTCDGPAFVRCGEYGLFLLSTTLGRTLPSDAAAAWSGLPPRRVAPADFGQLEAEREPLHLLTHEPIRTFTSVSYRPGPGQAHRDLIQPGETPRGALQIDGPRGSARLTLGPTALREGVLLGRYERCDIAEVFDETTSRVHALVIEIDGGVYVIDCSSTHGLSDGSAMHRVVPLGANVSMMMGRTRLDWRPIH